jgi:hypothetical protein
VCAKLAGTSRGEKQRAKLDNLEALEVLDVLKRGLEDLRTHGMRSPYVLSFLGPQSLIPLVMGSLVI